MHSLANPIETPGDVGNKHWWLLHANEEWVHRIAQVLCLGRVKDFRPTFAPIAQEFKDAITAARTGHINSLKHTEAVLDDDDDIKLKEFCMRNARERKARFDNAPLFRVTIGGHNLVALNCQRVLAIEATDAAREYIQQVVVPAMTSRSRAPSEAAAAPAEEEAPVAKTFCFTKDTLSVSGKVIWKPGSRSYKLNIRGPGCAKVDPTTDSEGKPLALPPGTDQTKEEQEKLFKLACVAWNEKDTSDRARIEQSSPVRN